MIFTNLIAALKTVKTEEDITPELLDELINVTITSTVAMVKQEQEEPNHVEAIEVARMTVLKHFDMVMLEALLNEEEDFESE